MLRHIFLLLIPKKARVLPTSFVNYIGAIINEKEVAISRNLLILSAPELGLEPRTL